MTLPDHDAPAAGVRLPPTLPWPPPGTEPLHGLLRRVRWRGLAAAVLVTLPTLFLALDPGYLVPDNHARWLLALLAAAVALGTAFWVGTGLAVLTVVDGVRRAAHLGYGRGLLLEVAADTRGDGGALAAGTGPYSGVAPETRASLRRLRVWRGWLAGLAAALPTPCVVAALLLAFRGGLGPLGVVLLTTGPAVTLAVVVGIMAGWERAAAALDRGAAAWDPDPATPEERAETWRAGAAAAGLTSGASGRGRGMLWAAGLTGVAALAVALLLTVTLVGTAVVTLGTLAVNSEEWMASVPGLLEAREMRGLVRGEPEDSFITPESAGAALHELLAPYGGPRWRDLAAEGVLRPAAEQATVPSLPVPLRRVAQRVTAFGRAERQRLRPEERALLEERPPAPSIESLRRVGQVPGSGRVGMMPPAEPVVVDVLGGRVRMPVPPARWDAVAVAASDALGQLTYATLLAALADAEAGRAAQAEARLRALLQFGSAVLWSTPFGLEAAEALDAVRFSAHGLRFLFESQGRTAEAADLRLALTRGDAAASALYERPSPSGDLAAELLEGLATGRGLPRATHLEALRRHESLRRCGSVSNVLFAPERFPLRDRDLAFLAPTPADSAYLETLLAPPTGRFWGRGAAAFIGGLLGERTVTGVCRQLLWANPRWRR